MIAPRLSSGQYGVETEAPDALAYVRASGARDLALGIGLFAARDKPKVRRALLLASILISAQDATNVVTRRGMRPNLVIHVAGAAALALAALAD